MLRAKPRDLKHPTTETECGEATDEESDGGGRDRTQIAARQRKRGEREPGEPSLVGTRERQDQEPDAGTRESEAAHEREAPLTPGPCRARGRPLGM